MSEELEFKVKDAASYDNVTADFDRLTEKYSTYVIDEFFNQVETSSADDIIDIGCGTGIVTIAAARRFHNSRITGVDLSDGMLALAQDKAENHKNVRFLKCDAERLEIPDASVDLAFSLYAFRHLPNPEAAAREVFRVLKPGGRFVVAVGSRPPLLSIAGGAAAISTIPRKVRSMLGRELSACEHLDKLVTQQIESAQTGETAGWQEHQHAFSGSLAQLVRSAGFTILASGWNGREFVISSIEEFWDLQATFSSFARKRLANSSEKQLSTLKARFNDECAAVQKRGGQMVYRVGAAIVSGEKNVSTTNT